MANQRYTPGYLPQQPPRGLVAAANANPFEDLLGAVENFGNKTAAVQAQRTAEDRVFSGQQPGRMPGFTGAQIVYNRAAEQAYEAKTESDVRTKVAELGAKYDGRNPTDPASFAEEFDAFAGATLGAVREDLRPRIGFEINARRGVALAALTNAANQHELRRNDSTLVAAINDDVAEAAQMARDGADPEALALLYQRADGRVDERVAMGLVSPAEAAIDKGNFRSAIQAEAVYGQGLRSGNIPEMVSDLIDGGPLAEGLSLRDRDAVIAKLNGEMSRQHAMMSRAENDPGAKQIRNQAKAVFWQRAYSGDPKQRPTPDQVTDAVVAGLLDGDDAAQLQRTLATDKVARNDVTVIASLESQMATGVDINDQIAESLAAGTVAPETAADLTEKNAKRQEGAVADPVRETREQIEKLFTKTGVLGDIDPGEAERKISALQFYDDSVKGAQGGMNPETGESFRAETARRAFFLLAQRQRERDISSLLAIPPRGANIETGADGVSRLNLGLTLGKLKTDQQVGLLSREQLWGELRLIDQWQRLGLTK